MGDNVAAVMQYPGSTPLMTARQSFIRPLERALRKKEREEGKEGERQQAIRRNKKERKSIRTEGVGKICSFISYGELITKETENK